MVSLRNASIDIYKWVRKRLDNDTIAPQMFTAASVCHYHAHVTHLNSHYMYICVYSIHIYVDTPVSHVQAVHLLVTTVLVLLDLKNLERIKKKLTSGFTKFTK